MFVDLEALYPTPEVLGTELCFEEMIAGHRGWLDKVWRSKKPQRPRESYQSQENAQETNSSVEVLSREVLEKLFVARDPETLDENGITKENVGRQGRGRRMKVKEVNETQISKSGMHTHSTH